MKVPEIVLMMTGAAAIGVVAGRLVAPEESWVRTPLMLSVGFLAAYPVNKRTWARDVPPLRYWLGQVVAVVVFFAMAYFR